MKPLLLMTLGCLFSAMSPVFGTQLLQIQAIWRHGDRTPSGTYPNDPYRENSWNLPFGELTTTGMWQQFQQGMKLKEEYTNKHKLINAKYDPNEIYVRSTDVRRTLVSAYSNLAGFYSESNNSYPNELRWPSNWTPIPVFTVPAVTDKLMNIVWSCPRRDQLDAKLLFKKEYQDMVAVNKDFYDLIQEKSGWNVTDAVNMFGLGNVLYIEKLYNMTLPSWVTDDVYNKIRAIGESGWDYAFGGAAYGMPEDVEMVKLYNGMLTTHIIENMKKMIGGKSKVLYHGFSGHDNTIAGFLRTLGAKDAVVGHETADYASTVVLELWKKKDGKHFVRVRWSANAETPFVSITDKVAGCPEKEYCPLDTFIQHREKYLVHDIAKACEVQPE